MADAMADADPDAAAADAGAPLDPPKPFDLPTAEQFLPLGDALAQFAAAPGARVHAWACPHHGVCELQLHQGPVVYTLRVPSGTLEQPAHARVVRLYHEAPGA